MAEQAIRVEGLKAFRKALKDAEPALGKELSKVGKAAAEVVATEARSRAFGLGGVAAKSAPTLKAGAAAGGGVVRYGGVPYAMGAEFGGRGRPTTQQFRPWRGNDEGSGYFLYPAFRDRRDEVVEQYGEAVDKIMRRAFPE